MKLSNFLAATLAVSVLAGGAAFADPAPAQQQSVVAMAPIPNPVEVPHAKLARADVTRVHRHHHRHHRRHDERETARSTTPAKPKQARS